MKKFFLLGVVGGLLLAGVAYFLWRVGQSLVQVVQDWRYAKEMDKIAAEAKMRKREGVGDRG